MAVVYPDAFTWINPEGADNVWAYLENKWMFKGGTPAVWCCKSKKLADLQETDKERNGQNRRGRCCDILTILPVISKNARSYTSYNATGSIFSLDPWLSNSGTRVGNTVKDAL